MASQRLHSSSGLPRDPKYSPDGLKDSALSLADLAALHPTISCNKPRQKRRDMPSAGGHLWSFYRLLGHYWDTGLRIAHTVIVMNPIHPPDRARARASSTSGTLNHPKAAESRSGFTFNAQLRSLCDLRDREKS